MKINSKTQRIKWPNSSIENLVSRCEDKQIRRQHGGGLPHLGTARSGSWQSNELQETADIYEKYSLSDNLLIDGYEKPSAEKIRLGGGSPARFPSYPGAIENMVEALQTRNFSDYPMAAGDEKDKEVILEYLKSIGFINSSPYPDTTINDAGLSLTNLIFTHSSTHAYTLVIEAIIDYGDVVITTAPNYGLFVFNPERIGAKVELISVCAEDDWLIKPEKLEQKINEVNGQLAQDYEANKEKYKFRRANTAPRVVAFLHMNPHNPTGKVYGAEQIETLKQIGNICLESGVFIIEDLAYRGLEFDRTQEAVPMASIVGQFANTISLFSLSKSFGLASLRAGMIVADEVVTSLTRDRIFQNTDSLSIVQSAALAGTFNATAGNTARRDEYLKTITEEYCARFKLVKAIVDGIHTLEPRDQADVLKVFDQYQELSHLQHDLGGIPGVKIVMEPDSGFFLLLDFTELLGKQYNGFVIEDDESLLRFLYTSYNIKLLTGRAFCWPYKNELVARVTTALDSNDLITSFFVIKKAVSELA